MISELNGSMGVKDQIDAALKMLGDVQPPEAIVTRVHQRLETTAMSQPTRSARRFLIPAAGVAMVAAVILAIFTEMHRVAENQASAVETARLVANTPPDQATKTSASATVVAERSQSWEASGAALFKTTQPTKPRNSTRHQSIELSDDASRKSCLFDLCKRRNRLICKH